MAAPVPILAQRRAVCHGCIRSSKENDMLHYAIVFLVIALIAGFLGFFGIAGTAAWIAKILFVVFIVLFLISLVTGRRPRV